MKITIELNERELEGLLFGRKVPEKKVECATYYGMIYRSRQIAEIMLNDLKNVAFLYGYVTVADYKDLSIDRGLRDKSYSYIINYKDSAIGWLYDTVRNAEVVRYKDGWKIDLPDPIDLE